jgi:spermidine/putrescine transport system permease protein
VNPTVGRFGRISLTTYFILLVGFLYTPLVVIFVFSFNNSTIPALPLSGFTTRWYHAAFNDSDMIAAVELSAKIAIANSIVATALGVVGALGLSARRVFLRPVVTSLVMLPLVVPYIVLAIGMLILIHEVGLNQSAAVVLAGHVVVTVPYTILIILPRLRTLDQSLPEAARDLGSGEVGAFWRITRPLITPAVISSMIVAFTISFDEYAIASFLIPPGERTFPIFVYSGTKVPASRPELLAIAAVVITVSMVLVVATEAGRQWVERRQTGSAGADIVEDPVSPR